MTEISIFVEKYFMIKAIIIGDDDHNLDLIDITVASYIPNVGIMARASDIKSGISAINEYEPDLILVDITIK